VPTLSYDQEIAKRREKWSAETTDLSLRMGEQLEAEVDRSLKLGRSIARARTEAKLTQPELAARAGVQQADISRIERGLGNPTRETLIRLASSLGMELTLAPISGPAETVSR